MELDDLKRQWQAQPVELPADTLTSEQDLRAMLTSHNASSPLVRLKKNASRELKLVLAAMLLIGFDALVFFRNASKMLLFAAGVFLIICLVGLIVYQRLKLIRQMEQQHDDLYHFLQSRIGRFRYLMRLHDYVGVGALALLALTGVVVRWAYLRAYLHPAQPNWGWHVSMVGVGIILLLILMYAAYRVGQKEHQHRYGRHLDQLAAALRELRE
ncbi:hypothetical protein ACFSX6_14670 [Hymenobacter rubripertinctus]|uniref:hypothetical protein n=1 Tax=Hymenobacter rubripertinctus TaxID=2029981 RepID=UPI0036385693